MARTSKLGLGTVQFGLDYGISNAGGQVALPDVRAILDAAQAAGIDLLDTAAGYGEAETVLGRALAGPDAFAIVTKTPEGAAPDEAAAAMRRSLDHLGTERLYAVMAHEADDLLGTDGPALWRRMEAFREAGGAERIGASVYSGDQIAALLELYRLDIVQVPLSVLDQRLVMDGTLERLKDAGVEIHARSLFLQGAVFLDPAALPASLSHGEEALRRFHAMRAETGMEPLHLAIAFALSRPEVDRAIVGVTSVAQLAAIVAAADAPVDSAIDFSRFAVGDARLLNPGQW